VEQKLYVFTQEEFCRVKSALDAANDTRNPVLVQASIHQALRIVNQKQPFTMKDDQMLKTSEPGDRQEGKIR
jgi:hypothetical protein